MPLIIGIFQPANNRRGGADKPRQLRLGQARFRPKGLNLSGDLIVRAALSKRRGFFAVAL